MSEDLWLQMKRLELQRKLLAQATKRAEKVEEKEAKPKDPYEVIRPLLEERADEVLEAARSQFPRVADAVAAELARLVEAGLIKRITGPWLMALFTRLGYRPRLETKISVISDGKIMDLKERISKALQEE
ncbi:MAG: double-stranded DNA-binding protein [Candidatus Verstraetearchaeota archaeon]|jgi:DNA-binding TFAR19-related protein (PDSD5 family)|nr:double-stranded DNA-binding protein [Candidatus Verstraetearchaeota archaeon]